MKIRLFTIGLLLIIQGCGVIPETVDLPQNEIVIIGNIRDQDTLVYDLDSLFINSVSDHETPVMKSNSDTSKVDTIAVNKEQILFFGKAEGSAVIKFHVSENNILNILYFQLTVDPCPVDLLDCSGKCNGTAEKDSCDVCGGDNAPLTGTCDCAGTPNGESVVDCLGECDGVAELDDCGVCEGDNDCNCPGYPEGTSPDCNGDCGGTAELDDCGVCEGDNSSCTDCAGVPNGESINDCNGDCGGTAQWDNCDVCNDDPSDDCVPDCAGEWGGDAVIDNCGNCDDITSNNCELAKAVLVEVFTNDGCTPCVPVNHLLDVLFEDYNENITMIRYHWNSPSPTDPMYHYNPVDVELRREMYSILFCPVAVVNGIHILPGQQNIESDSEINIHSELANESILYLGHEASLDNDIIVVDLEILPFETIDGPVKSWAVVVEDSIDHEGYNGETIHMQVMRDLAEGEQWSVLESDLSYSTSISLLKPEGYSDESTLFHIVTMIQNTVTNQVIQSNRLHAPIGN